MIRLKPPAACSSKRGRSEGKRERGCREDEERERERGKEREAAATEERGRGERRGDLTERQKEAVLKVKQFGVDVEKRAGAAIGTALACILIAFSLSCGREG